MTFLQRTLATLFPSIGRNFEVRVMLNCLRGTWPDVGWLRADNVIIGTVGREVFVRAHCFGEVWAVYARGTAQLATSNEAFSMLTSAARMAAHSPEGASL